MPNLYSFGTNVYLDDMINIIGAKNIFENTLLGQDRKSVSLMFENEK